MIVDKRTEEGVSILDLKGKLTIGEGDVAMREAIERLLSQGAKKILLNMQGVTVMDSSGLGELVRCKATVAAADAEIKLLHVESKVAEVLEMTHLIGVFETFDDEIDALASFR